MGGYPPGFWGPKGGSLELGREGIKSRGKSGRSRSSNGVTGWLLRSLRGKYLSTVLGGPDARFLGSQPKGAHTLRCSVHALLWPIHTSQLCACLVWLFAVQELFGPLSLLP